MAVQGVHSPPRSPWGTTFPNPLPPPSSKSLPASAALCLRLWSPRAHSESRRGAKAYCHFEKTVRLRQRGAVKFWLFRFRLPAHSRTTLCPIMTPCPHLSTPSPPPRHPLAGPRHPLATPRPHLYRDVLNRAVLNSAVPNRVVRTPDTGGLFKFSGMRAGRQAPGALSEGSNIPPL